MKTSIYDAFNQVAQAQPSAESLYFAGQSLSFGELDNHCSVLASVIHDFLDNPDPVEAGLETCIGLFMNKRLESVISLYGILRSGCAYVPLDVKNPADRLRYIIDQCKIRLFVTCADNLDELTAIVEPLTSTVDILVLSEDELVLPDTRHRITRVDLGSNGISIKPPTTSISSDHLAAVLYTSGSTGTPKGVMITHGNVLTFTDWSQTYFDITASDRCISHAPLHFDLSLFDIYAAHLAGASTVLVPDGMGGNPKFLTKFVALNRISIWQSVPSVLVLMLKYGDLNRHDFSALRHVLFAGERVSTSNICGVAQYFNAAVFHNVYGCTETNDTFVYSFNPATQPVPDPLPIGKPLSYVDVLVVDSSDQSVIKGQPGELLVKAPTHMRGYRHQLQEEPGFDSRIPNAGYYRTKDIVFENEQGDYVFCGRTDDIVKTNGYRVNLLEIENLLQTHPLIKEVAVIPQSDDEIGNRIIAVINAPDKQPSVIELKKFCAEKLPKYAIPHIIEIGSTELPKTSSGKTSKQTIIKLRARHVETA